MSLHVPLTPVRQRLAAAVSFVDAFADATAAPTLLRNPMRVSIPELRWRSVVAGADGIYRFAYPGGTVVAGTFDVEIEIPDGRYVDFESLSLTLPRPVSSPPLRTDFWVIRRLWPTRLLPPIGGETQLEGRITSPTDQRVEGLRVVVHPSSSPPPSAPYTYTNAAGEFLFRFPELGGPVPSSTQSLFVSATDSTMAPVPITPSSVSAQLGQRQFFAFERN